MSQKYFKGKVKLSIYLEGKRVLRNFFSDCGTTQHCTECRVGNQSGVFYLLEAKNETFKALGMIYT